MEPISFTDFKFRARLSFADEITTQLFRVYQLPHGFTSINEKVLIQTEDEFQSCIDLFKNPDQFPPELYVWNFEDVSPKKLPNPITPTKTTGSSVVSRSTSMSMYCKERDKNTCTCCGYIGANGNGMQAAHLYEIKAHQKIVGKNARKQKLEELDLLYINDLHNLVTLCQMCHSNFDTQKIGIDALDGRWIVTDGMREMVSPSSHPRHSNCVR